MSGESPPKQHQQQEVPGQELSQPVSTSSSAASSPSSVSALSLPPLVRSQSVPVPLPAPAQLVENVQSPMALHAIMSAPVSYAPPYTPPQYFASVRVQQQQQQQLPSLTSEYAEYRYESAARSVNEPGFTRRPSLPPLSQFVDSQNPHQFPTSHPYRPPMQRRIPSDPPPPPLPRPAPSSSASSTSREPGQQMARSTSVGGATRRPKPHVIAACSNCKKAHLACDVGRPCQRCINLGKQDTCVDVRHKKRGRPRLRDDLSSAGDRSSSASTTTSTSPVSTYSVATAAPTPTRGPGYRAPPQLYSHTIPPPRSTLPNGDLYVVTRPNRDLHVLQMSPALRRRTPVPATLGDILGPDPAREERISRALHTLTRSADENPVATAILTSTPLADLVAPVVLGASGLSPATARQISSDRACVVFYVRDTIRGTTVEYVVVRIIDSVAPAPLRRGFGLDDILG